MRHTKLVIPFLLGAALAMGCKATKEKSAAETKQDETAALQLGKAKTATREAAQAMEDYAYTRKAEFVVKMHEELVAMQEEVDRLAAKVDSSAGARKDEAKAKLEEAKSKGGKLGLTKEEADKFYEKAKTQGLLK